MRIELAYPMTAGELASVVGSPCPIVSDTVITAITTDSRMIRAGDLFVAIRGKNHDGHLFLGDAKKQGASLLLAARSGTDILSVEDTQGALSAIAAHTLRKHPVPIVAITGSVGKTGTKEAVGAVLGTRFRVHKTLENQNNELGLAYTLLSRKKDTEAMVLEFGTNNRGEIAGHAAIAPPDVAIITAIGTAHIGAFGSREAILSEKSDIYKGMSEGLLVLNGDDPLLKGLSPEIPVCYVGTGDGCDLAARKVFFSRYGVSYTLCTKKLENRIFLRGVGIPRIYASLFALAVGAHFGVREDLAADALFRMPEPKGRQSILNVGGILLIDDAYNASPEAMAEALRLLLTLPTAGRRYAVLGDMLELGGMSEELHHEVGLLAAKSADLLYSFGDYASCMADGAAEGGMPQERIFTFEGAEACLAFLKPRLTDGDTVLVKASHSLGGAEIVRGICTLVGRSQD